MSMVKDGGPAFPTLTQVDKFVGHKTSTTGGPHPTYERTTGLATGLSLRDYFAAHALAGMLGGESNPMLAKARRNVAEKLGRSVEDTIALECYQLADAMLKERAAR